MCMCLWFADVTSFGYMSKSGVLVTFLAVIQCLTKQLKKEDLVLTQNLKEHSKESLAMGI